MITIDEKYMQLAIQQAQKAAEVGEVPIGAIVVKNADTEAAEVISSAFNLRETNQDPSAHAEFMALCHASKKLNTWRLTDCTVYVTLEPCIMCAGLMHQARITRCVYGAYDKKAGALGTLYNINTDERLNHNFEVKGGVLEKECVELLQKFFKKRRAENKKARQ